MTKLKAAARMEMPKSKPNRESQGDRWRRCGAGDPSKGINVGTLIFTL